MKIKTAELQGAPLEWAVAMCERIKVEIHSAAMIMESRLRSMSPVEEASLPRPKPYCTIPGRHQAAFSSDWAQGGPIIDQMMLGSGLVLLRNANHRKKETCCVASLDSPAGFYFGPTPLIAAMRCYVASKLGDEIEIPEELLK